MVKVSVFYPNKPGSRFDVEYYLNTHMPMANRLLEPALKAVQVEIGASGATPRRDAALRSHRGLYMRGIR